MTPAQIEVPAQIVVSEPFQNEPFLDFSNPDVERRMKAALLEIRSRLGQEYDMVIGGQRLRTADKIISRNPAHPDEIIGVHQRANLEHVDAAMQAAETAFASSRWCVPTASSYVPG